MKKFRVLSDLHIDVNEKHPLKIKDKNVFTVICGDTSGDPKISIEWINKNIKNGVGISGNHLPYNKNEKTIQELREELAVAFPKENNFTYLDCETNVFFKEVDEILFVGTCMYTDMHISHPVFNQHGSPEINMYASVRHMNDYRWGIKSKHNFLGADNDMTTIKISPDDYFQWFKNAYNKIEKILTENEQKQKPLPVVLITHHSLLPIFLKHSGYIEDAYSMHDYNWASYASDHEKWLKRHTSIKCYCCGHIHDVEKNFRHFELEREDGSKILVVNNARGYVRQLHDFNFNKNLYVDVDNWQVIEEPISKKEQNEQKKRAKKLFSYAAFCF